MKLRDLQKSHDFREAVKKWGEPARRRRVIIAPPSSNVEEKDVTISPNDVKSEGLQLVKKSTSIDKEIEEVQPEREELKSWVKEKKALREGLNSLRLSEFYLKNKPNKTLCETRVLDKMVEIEKRKKSKRKDVPTISFAPKISSAHVDVLPLLDSPLPIGLAIIADYLQENRMRLLDLFSKADRNKDWLTTREELRSSLKDGGVPLTDAQINELVITLDVNNDDQLSYKELAMGIDAYRKDRRWQKLKEIFDVLVEKGDAEIELAESYNERRTAMDLLRLPKFDNDKQNIELLDHLSVREKRARQQIEKRKRKVKIKNGIKTEYITTMTGLIGDSKIRYLQFIDNECKRCIQAMHRNELPTKSEDLVSILIPPPENPRIVCESYVGCDRSIFPFNHRMNKRYRHSQGQRLRFQSSAFSSTSTTSSPVSTTSSLPRVATTDFKNRAKEGRKRREQFNRTSPTPCWPQHLLDKLRIYMESDVSGDGKEVLFAQIRQS